MRLQCGLLLGLVLLVGCTKQADTKQANKEEIFFVRHVVTMEGGTRTSVAQSSFNAILVTKQGDGAQTVRERILWSRQTGTGYSSGTLRMNPDDADEKLVLGLLAGGVSATLDKDGSVSNVHAVDQQAFTALVQRSPEAAALFGPRESSTDLRPVTLPDQLRVGQEFTRKNPSTFGLLTARMRVTALTDDVAMVDVTVEGNGVHGGGQQAIRRRDGMPIEMQFELVRDAKDEAPAATVQISAVNMAHPPEMEIGADAGMYRLNRDVSREALAKPPFSAQSDDARLYYLQPDKEGELAPWMLSTAILDQIDEHLFFGVIEDSKASRPIIAMGGKMPAASPSGGGSDPLRPVVMAELRKAMLLDASGRELPDLATVPVHRKIMFMDEYRAKETDMDFPFRLPLQTRAAQLTGLETIRLDVAVEIYTWAGSETVKAGEQSKVRVGARITWTGPQRVTLEQAKVPFGMPKGEWTIAVPLDAEGRQIPSASLETSAYVDERDPQHPQTLPPLDWEHRRLPLRQEIAAAQPIVALQLRHYNWEQVPREWKLRNAKHMKEPVQQR